MQSIVEKQKQFYFTGQTRDYAFRMKQLNKLKTMLETYEEEIYDALKMDLNKSKHESLTTELGILYTEINFTMKHLKKWMETEDVPTPLTHKGTSNYIMYEPYGVTLIISPWNYPVQLALAPVIGAIAAGNTVVLKPSELTPHTSGLINKMVTETFPATFFTVVEGDKDASQALLAQRFDYIFFTGSTNVGKIVMKEAAKNITPLTLELGGKSPTIVDRDCHVNFAAKRIAWGKFTNAGQTCVAPDYVYVHEKVKKKFLKALKKQIVDLYGKNTLQNDDYVRIVNSNHFNRLFPYLSEGTLYHGGDYDRTRCKMEPTVITDITWDDEVMQEEIFGPILPILTYKDLDDIIPIIQREEKPLALYYFGRNKKNEQKVLQNISFGGGCVNDTLYHLANPHLPFGGVGQSGLGAYHGKTSFKTFSHAKSMLKQTNAFDIPVRYPGGKLATKLAEKLFK
ncbi:MAG TPA: aldehyde dehydrogenase [Pseudogracilibacillus sp.]|nr:aldehyde dehydrogenase [Pseudogracilibacillus sp.]